MSQEPGRVVVESATAWELSHSYPALVSQALGFETQNLAIPGGSNDAMFRLVVSDLALVPGDIVIACWTGWDRHELWHPEENLWLQISGQDRMRRPGGTNEYIQNESLWLDYQRHWIALAGETKVGFWNRTRNVLALNTWAQAQGCKVINIDSFGRTADVAWPNWVFWPAQQDFMAWAEEQGAPRTAWGHYYLPTHRAWADLLLDTCQCWLETGT
jgi:hypothetical protein